MKDFTLDAYEGQQQGSSRSARAVVPLLLQLTKASSVIDVGCGVGTWLEAFREAGVTDVMGVDGSYVRPEWLHIPKEYFQAHDLSQELKLGRQFDVAISLEVAEHLPPEAAERFVRTLTSLSPVVLFSAAVPQQGGFGHLNEQWPEYWHSLFDARGYVAVDCLRGALWRNEEVEWWYRQNMILYVRADSLNRYPALANYLPADLHVPPPAMIHPRLYSQHCWAADPENWRVGTALQALTATLKRAIARRVGGSRPRPTPSSPQQPAETPRSAVAVTQASE